VIERYRIILLHRRGMSVGEIAEATGRSLGAVSRILRRPTPFPEGYLKVREYIRRNPFATGKECAEACGLSRGYVSQILGMMFHEGEPEEVHEGYRIVRGLIREGDYRSAVALLEILPLSDEALGVIDSLPTEMITPMLRIYDLGSRTYDPSYRHRLDAMYGDVMKSALSQGDLLAYYHAAQMYIRFLMLNARWREARSLLNSLRGKYLDLPTPLFLKYSALAGMLALIFGEPDDLKGILVRLRHKAESMRRYRGLRKRVILELLMAQGRYSEASKYSLSDLRGDGASLFSMLLKLHTGAFREVLRMEVGMLGSPMGRLFTAIYRGAARIILGYRRNALSGIHEAYASLRGIAAADIAYNYFMAFYHATGSDTPGTRRFLAEVVRLSGGMGVQGRISKALLLWDVGILLPFNVEHLLRLCMEGRMAKAREKAEKGRMVFDLHRFNALISAVKIS